MRKKRVTGTCSRRQFLGGVLAVTASGTAWQAPAAENKLAFTAVGKEFHFDTGVLRGTFYGKGRKSIEVVDCVSASSITQGGSLFAHYRLFDDQARYGNAAWGWASEAKLLDNGGVEVRWTSDNEYPFDMIAVYRWSAPNTLDLTTRVTARKELKSLEVFLASYFEGFPATSVYAKDPAAGGQPIFIATRKSDALWHMFPRDEEAVKMIKDGRWKHPPAPMVGNLEWAIRPTLAAPLAIRRDTARGLAAVLMARAQDCFAVAAPHDEHNRYHSVYLSLFGRDFKSGESAAAKSRLIIGPDISDEKAVALYEKFREQENS